MFEATLCHSCEILPQPGRHLHTTSPDHPEAIVAVVVVKRELFRTCLDTSMGFPLSTFTTGILRGPAAPRECRRSRPRCFRSVIARSSPLEAMKKVRMSRYMRIVAKYVQAVDTSRATYR